VKLEATQLECHSGF